MGFAWSSFVARETLLGVCKRAGLSTDLALSIGRPVLASTHLFPSLAADDVMVFSKEAPGFTFGAARLLDEKLVEAGIERHEGKDENDVLDSTCDGVRLSDGRCWWPPPSRTWSLMLGGRHLCDTRVGSSGTLLAYLGVLRWLGLLQRGKFCFLFGPLLQ